MHEQAVTFRHALDGAKDISPKVLEILRSEFKNIEASADLKAYNQEYLTKHGSSARHSLAAIRAQRILGENRSVTDKALLELLNLKGIAFSDAIQVLNTLQNWKSPEVDNFKKVALDKWPEVTRFS